MKAPSGDSRPPLAVAMEWVSQITTVVAEMVLPGLAGHWLDHRWGTQFLALLGFALGLTIGIWHLIAMTRPRTTSPTSSGNGVRDRLDTRIPPDDPSGADKKQD